MLLTLVIIIILYLVFRFLFRTKSLEPKRPSIKGQILELLESSLCHLVLFEPSDIYYYQNNYIEDRVRFRIVPSFFNAFEIPDNLVLLPEIEERNDILGHQMDMEQERERRDRQNVHDTYFGKQCSEQYKKIKHFGEGLRDIEKEYLTETSRQAVEKIKQRNDLLIRFDSQGELAILKDVMAKIDEEPDEVKKAMQQDELNFQLEDCLQDGELVCPTGTSSRILMALNITDLEHYPKTSNLFREEIIGLVGKWVTAAEERSVELDKREVMDRLVEEYGVSETNNIREAVKDWIDDVFPEMETPV